MLYFISFSKPGTLGSISSVTSVHTPCLSASLPTLCLHDEFFGAAADFQEVFMWYLALISGTSIITNKNSLF